MLLPIDYEKTTSTGFMFNTKDGLVEHLNVEHPSSLFHYIEQLPKLHSATFDFRKTAFRKADTNPFAQITELLEKVKLTRLSIIGSKKLKGLPEIIKRHPFRVLKITSCPNVTDLKSILSALPTLEHLELNGEYFDIGASFPSLPNLRYFKCGAAEISSLEQISNCKKLENLEVSQFQGTNFPEEFSNLPNLKELNIFQCPKLETLSSFKKSDQLEKITLNHLPQLKSINIDFFNKKHLEKIDFRMLGNKEVSFPFPNSLTNCTALETILIGAVNFPEIPETFSQLAKVKTLSFFSMKIKTLPDQVFQNMSELEVLRLRYCNLEKIPKSISDLKNLKRLDLANLQPVSSLDINFEKLSKLKNLHIERCNDLINIDESLSLNSSVENLNLNGLQELKILPSLGVENEKLRSVELRALPKIESLLERFTSIRNLVQLSIVETGLKRLPDDFGNLKMLNNLTISGNDFEYFPLSIANLPSIERIWISRDVSNKNPEVVSIREIFPNIKKLEDQSLREAIFFWVGYGFEHLPVTKTIKTKTLEALQHSIKNLPLLVLGNIHRFNPEQKAIGMSQLQSGDKVWINGNIDGGKTDFKNKLKAIDLKVVNNFASDVKFVIVGKKPKLPESLFDGDTLFASQLEFENISKTKNPGLLQQEDVPSDFIYNLQQLLWSGDPQNEAVALELVKTNGLPESVEEDFLLSAKICTDKNLRNRIRTFIRGKINEVKQKALSTGSAPFRVEKLNRVLPDDSLAKMYFGHYKRTGKLSHEYFKHDIKGEHVFRAEAFAAALPDFLRNHQYLSSFTPLLKSEWNQVFEQDVFKGQLKRIVFQLKNINEIPERLFDHIDTLKDIQVTLPKVFEIKGLFRFFKLNKLSMDVNNLEVFPKGIGQLKRLRDLLVYSTVQLEMPEDLKELEKLNRLMIQNWSNRDDFLDFVETIK